MEFIWGEGRDERRYHKVRWSVVTKSIDVGGLGMRKLDVMNQVCILEIGWNLHAGNENLCSVVLWRKYNQHCMKDIIIKNPRDSSLWKSIVNLWPMINKDCFWSICDGNTVEAWNMKWIALSLRIKDLDLYFPNQICSAKIVDLKSDDGCWY